MSENTQTVIKCTDCGKTATVPLNQPLENQFIVENASQNTGHPQEENPADLKQERRNPQMKTKLGLDAEKTGDKKKF
jgi:hypothetical protein